jgi:hypothetical protein
MVRVRMSRCEPAAVLQAIVVILGLGTVTGGCGGGGDALTSPPTKGNLDTTATLDTTASLQLSATTTGPSPDPDGYTITLDGADRGVVGADFAITVTGVAPGSHTVGIGGVAANCAVQGDPVRTVVVPAGSSATVAFAVTCAEAPPPPPPPPPPLPPRPGIPFGFFRMEFTQLSSDWTSLKRVAIPETILQNLEIARSQGGRVFLQLARGHSHYQNRDRSFNLEKFKEMLDQIKGLDLDSYIADGTIAGHLMIDEPSDPSNWGGSPIPYETIEEAARYSKSLWPDLPTLVRSKPSWLANAPFRWKYLDAGWAQYAARFGDINGYRDVEIRGASDAGLQVVWGLNVTDGGDGRSRRPGRKRGKFSMSAEELLHYGTPLIEASSTCGFLAWMYEGEYLKDDDVLTALKTLSQAARNQPSRSCGIRAQESSAE